MQRVRRITGLLSTVLFAFVGTLALVAIEVLMNYKKILLVVFIGGLGMPIGASMDNMFSALPLGAAALETAYNTLLVEPVNKISECLRIERVWYNTTVAFVQAIISLVAEEFGVYIFPSVRAPAERSPLGDAAAAVCNILTTTCDFLTAAVRLIGEFALLVVESSLTFLLTIADQSFLSIIVSVLNSQIFATIDPNGCYTPIYEAPSRLAKCMCPYAGITPGYTPTAALNAFASCLCPGVDFRGDIIDDILKPCLSVTPIEILLGLVENVRNTINTLLGVITTIYTGVVETARKTYEIADIAKNAFEDFLDSLEDAFCDVLGCRSLPDGTREYYNRTTGERVFSPRGRIEAADFDPALAESARLADAHAAHQKHYSAVRAAHERERAFELSEITRRALLPDPPGTRTLANPLGGLRALAEYSETVTESRLRAALLASFTLAPERDTSGMTRDMATAYTTLRVILETFRGALGSGRSPRVHEVFARFEAAGLPRDAVRGTIRAAYGERDLSARCVPRVVEPRRIFEREASPIRVVPVLAITFALSGLGAISCLVVCAGTTTALCGVFAGILLVALVAVFLPVAGVATDAIADALQTLITGESGDRFTQDFVSDWFALFAPFMGNAFLMGLDEFDFAAFAEDAAALALDQTLYSTTALLRKALCVFPRPGLCPPRPYHTDNIPEYTLGLLQCDNRAPCQTTNDCPGRATKCVCDGRTATFGRPCNATAGQCACWPYVDEDATMERLDLSVLINPQCEEIGFLYKRIMPYQGPNWLEMLWTYSRTFVRGVKLVTNKYSAGVFVPWIGLAASLFTLIPFFTKRVGSFVWKFTLFTNIASYITIYLADWAESVADTLHFVPYLQETQVYFTDFDNAASVGGRGSATMREYVCAVMTVSQFVAAGGMYVALAIVLSRVFRYALLTSALLLVVELVAIPATTGIWIVRRLLNSATKNE